MSANETLRDRAIAHAIQLSRYNTGLVEQILKLLNSTDSEIATKVTLALADIDERGINLSRSAQKRLSQLVDELSALNSAVYEQMGQTLSDELTGLATVEAEFQKAGLARAIPASYSTVLPAPARLKAIVETSLIAVKDYAAPLSGWLDGMEKGRIDRIDGAIRSGLVQGLTNDDIIKKIRGTRAGGYQDGILNVSRQSAQRMVRTFVTHVSNQAAQETWKANSDVIKGIQFHSVLDSRTTFQCASLDGKFYPNGDNPPQPPLHINCRSFLTPVTKSWSELGIDAKDVSPSQRASMDGQVPASTTFSKWLKGKDAAFQDQYLGKGRADLWRSGKLSMADLVRPDGTAISLDQLRRIHGL